jgi:hypothetical protein
MTIRPENMMYVRPSQNNLHTFTATENSMFFDICLPNYTQSTHDRKITYFKDSSMCETESAADNILLSDEKSRTPIFTTLTYDTTAPNLPVDLVLNEI